MVNKVFVGVTMTEDLEMSSVGLPGASHRDRTDFLGWQRLSGNASQTRKARVCCEPLKTVERSEGSFPTASTGGRGGKHGEMLPS